MSTTGDQGKPRWVPERLDDFPGARLATYTKTTAIFRDVARGHRIQLFSRKVANRLGETQENLETWTWDVAGICRIHEVTRIEGLLAFVSDWVEGQLLGEKLGEPLPLAAGLRLVASAAEVLAGIEAHPDAAEVWRPGRLSPWSLWVEESSRVCWDAPALAAAASAAMALRQPNRHLAYLAPEQVLGRDLDLRTDLYILGVMAYELLSGVHPFLGETSSQTIRRVTDSNPAPPSTHAPWIPRRLDEAILAAIERNPDSRPSSLSSWKRMLQELLHTVVPGQPPADSDPGRGFSLAHAVLGIPDESPEHPTLILEEASAPTDEPTLLLEQPDWEASGTVAAASHPELATASTRTRSPKTRPNGPQSRSWRAELLLGVWLVLALALLVYGHWCQPSAPRSGPKVLHPTVLRPLRQVLRVEVQNPGSGFLLLGQGRCLPPAAVVEGEGRRAFWFRLPEGSSGQARFCLKAAAGRTTCSWLGQDAARPRPGPRP